MSALSGQRKARNPHVTASSEGSFFGMVIDDGSGQKHPICHQWRSREKYFFKQTGRYHSIMAKRTTKLLIPKEHRWLIRDAVIIVVIGGSLYALRAISMSDYLAFAAIGIALVLALSVELRFDEALEVKRRWDIYNEEAEWKQ